MLSNRQVRRPDSRRVAPTSVIRSDLFRCVQRLLAKYHVDEPQSSFHQRLLVGAQRPTNDANATQPRRSILVGDLAQPSFRLARRRCGWLQPRILPPRTSRRTRDPANYGRRAGVTTDTLTRARPELDDPDTRRLRAHPCWNGQPIHYGNSWCCRSPTAACLCGTVSATERISTASEQVPPIRVLVVVRIPTVAVRRHTDPAESLDQVFGAWHRPSRRCRQRHRRRAGTPESKIPPPRIHLTAGRSRPSADGGRIAGNAGRFARCRPVSHRCRRNAWLKRRTKNEPRPLCLGYGIWLNTHRN